MAVVDVVDDLIALQRLAEGEADPSRRATLDAVRSRLAARDRGVKVTDAAAVLGLSSPTVRSWLEAGVLDAVDGATPVRVDVRSLADVKHAVDLLREHGHDRNLLVEVMHRLRDRALLDMPGVHEGLGDHRAGKVVPLGDDLKAEIAQLRERKARRRSTSP